MLSLFLLRHGETEFSRQDRFCGNIDAALTRSGHEMARAFADAHGTLPWTAIYTSSRERAIQTARPLAARTGLTVTVDADLDEIDYGDWQGLTKDQILAADADYFQRWKGDPTIGAPGGESPFDVAKRVLRTLDRVRATHADGNVLLVAHKTVHRILICLLTGTELRRYRELPQPAAALSIVDVHDVVPTLRVLADTTYLTGSVRDSVRALPLPGVPEAPQPQAAA